MKDDILRIKDKTPGLVDNYSEINFKNEEFVMGISEVKVFGKAISNTELKNIVETTLNVRLTEGRFN